MAVDWTAIETEYITTQMSYRKLAEKYNVSRDLVSDHGKDGGWVEKRRQFSAKTMAKTIEQSSRKKADQMARIDRVTDRLLEKLERAVEELEIHLVTNTRKEKVIEYNNSLRPDKPTKETIQEHEEIVQVSGIVDKAGLRQITAALKDIKEIKMLRTALDEREQQARIDNLERQASKDASNKEPVSVVMDDALEDYTV